MADDKLESRLKKFLSSVACVLFDEFLMLVIVIIIGLVMGTVLLLTGIIR